MTSKTLIFYLAFEKDRKLTWLQILIERYDRDALLAVKKKEKTISIFPHLCAAALNKISVDMLF